MAIEFDVIAKIRADFDDLKKQMRNLPKNVKDGLKVQLDTGAGDSKVGRDLTKETKGLLAQFKKFAIIGVAFAIVAKASPKLFASLERLTRTLLLVVRPIGDLLARLINPLTRFIRQFLKVSKGVAKETGLIGEELGKSFADKVADQLGAEGDVAKQITDIGGEVGGAAGKIIGGSPITTAAIVGAGVAEDILRTIGLGDLVDKLPENVEKIKQQFRDMRDDISSTGNQIKAIWDSVTGELGVKWSLLTTLLKDKWGEFIADAQRQFTEWKEIIINQVLTPLGTRFLGFFAQLKQFLKDTFIDPAIKLWTEFKDGAISAWDGIKEHIESNPIIQIIRRVVQTVGGVVDVVGQEAEKLFGKQVGGVVAQDGVFMLHRGEKVLRPGEQTGGTSLTFAPQVTINVPGGISTNIDFERVMEDVNRSQVEELRRLL